ncbi:MAG: hypothetical protein R2769_10030 [Saprospiraceae bacterium]
MQGDIFQKDDRFSKEVFENNAFVMVKLQPLTEAFKAYITEIKVFFDKKDMMVAKVEMVEGEDLTKIMFENRKLTPTCHKICFRFQANKTYTKNFRIFASQLKQVLVLDI